MNRIKLPENVPGFEPSIPSNRISASGNYAGGIAALDELKQRLLREKTGAASDPAISSCLRQAAEEAVSMAWTTPYPLLVLPELFDEKAAEANLRWQRQSDIRQRSQRLVALATGEACGQERQRQRMKIVDPNRRRLFTPLSQFSFATPPIGVQDFAVRSAAKQEPGITCPRQGTENPIGSGVGKVAQKTERNRLCVQKTEVNQLFQSGADESGPSNRRG
ncbi:MAG: hypothetical protein DME18_07080 [Verrucomicrobia bacterium]|nr:MAG: hypothetical protein DME18_07080 [Verrucomicrobiota bacterium]